MYKKIKLLSAALLVGASLASAQNVTVTMNDGTMHRFGAAYIKEMNFVTTTPAPPAIALTQIDVNNYGGTTNVGMTLKDAYGDNEFAFDLYQPSTPYLASHVFDIASSGDYHIDSDPSYTYYKQGETKKTIKSGTVTISNVEATYTILINVVLEDGTPVAGKYIGALNKFSQYVDVTFTGASYNSNPQPKGKFLIKFNDADWANEATLHIFSSQNATTLEPGTYTYSTEGTPMTFNNQTYITVGRSELKPTQGSTVTVAGTADNMTITIKFITPEGLYFNATFSGKIGGTPAFE